jgi:cytochrome P450
VDAGTYSHLAHANELEPAPGHAHLRERCPVHHEVDHDPDFYVVSRFDDCLRILRHPERWGNRDGPGVFFQPGGVLGATDDPDHRRQRKVLQPAFLPPAIAGLADRLDAIAGALFDDFVAEGEGDFVELFAFPFPALAIAELLGVRPEDRGRFRHWSDDIVRGLGGKDLDRYDLASREIQAYIEERALERDALLDAAGADVAEGEALLGAVLPADVISRMVLGERQGLLSRDELRRLGYQLLVAGHETTTGLIGLLLYRLAQQPALIDELRADPELIDVAVEEGLRFDSPVQGLFRTNDVAVDLGDERLEPRTKLQVLFAAANRDPRRWDDPDTFRLDRDPKRLRGHLAFGWGIHHCIGAPLARLETRIALRHVLARMDDLEVLEPPTVNDPFILRGFTSLRLRWTPR